jgi:nitrate/TMAO reductase-like tetraheme cytochrome c subunit
LVGGLVLCLALMLGWAIGGAQAGHSSSTCAKCHVPHRAGLPTDANASWGVPLWNVGTYNGKNVTNDGATQYTLYSSDTFKPLATDISQPDGASKLCLGCHDGTYVKPSSMSAFAGTDDLLDSHGKMQCISCHDVHASGKGATMLRFDWDPTLLSDNTFCRTCHSK